MIIDNIEQYQKQSLILLLLSGPAGLTLALNLEKKNLKLLWLKQGIGIFQKNHKIIIKEKKTLSSQEKQMDLG